MTFERRIDIIGTDITLSTSERLLDLIDQRPEERATTFAFCNVHSVMSARSDQHLAAALAHADVTAPDGVPLVWALRLVYKIKQERVYGPDFMRLALARGVARGWHHFFYGADQATLNALRVAAAELAPGVLITGVHAPPFRTLNERELTEDAGMIRESGADLVWVGLGLPKQEIWMHRVRDQLPGQVLLGVGAAFDFLAGTRSEAPGWIQRASLGWLYRLISDPRRLWRRYAVNNPLFLFLLAGQVARTRLSRSSIRT